MDGPSRYGAIRGSLPTRRRGKGDNSFRQKSRGGSAARGPHPALRATFPVRGEGLERADDGDGPFESTMKTRWSYDPSVIRRTVTRRMPPPLAQGRFYGPPKAAAPTTVGPGQRNPAIGPYEGRSKETTPSVSCRAEDPLRGALIRRFAPPVHLAVPEKPFGLTLILRFFDRCGNCEFPSSATGGGNSQFPVRGEGF